MKYQYVKPEELSASNKILAVGPANFVIKDASEYDKNGNPLVSQTGYPYFQMTLKVTDNNGDQGVLYEKIYSHVQWKMLEFLNCIGCSDLYNEQGEINVQMLPGNGGECLLEIEHFTKRNGEEASKTKVKEWKEPAADAKKMKQEINTQFFNDDIPF